MMLHDALEFRIPYVWLEGLAGTGRTLLNLHLQNGLIPWICSFRDTSHERGTTAIDQQLMKMQHIRPCHLF